MYVDIESTLFLFCLLYTKGALEMHRTRGIQECEYRIDRRESPKLW